MWVDELNEGIIDLSLKRMKKFIDEEGKLNYKIIHIGGTNGKGSVCQFIASILSRKYKVGVYTSPHLEKVNERIVVDGTKIKNEEIAKYEYLKKYGFTYFEALTAIATLYFKERKVNYAIMEVGLGGRYDATNVIHPTITIITNVAKEHEKYLGNDILSIAKEKAGIIKDAPVITAAKGKALDVIKDVAEKRGVDLYIVGKHIIWKKIGKRKFFIETEEEYEIESPLYGNFQGENIAIAIKACELLNIKKQDIIEGIKNARWAGRMEKIGKFLLDGCHNPHAIEAFISSLEDFDYSNLVIIFGAMKDKNINEMIKRLPEGKYITTKINNERAAEPEKIAEIGKKYGKKFFVARDIAEAIKIAEETAGEKDMVCIIGSLYLVGEARKLLRQLIS